MEKHYAAGEIIIRRDEIAPFLVRIRSGKVRFETPDDRWDLSDGDLFGEEGIFLKKPSPYTAAAAIETTVELLTEPEAASFLAGTPAAALLAIQRNVARLHRPTGPLTADNMRYMHLLALLLPHTVSHGDAGAFSKLSISLQDIAVLLETTPESVRMLLSEASLFGDLVLNEDDSISAKGTEHLRNRIAAARNASYFPSGPTRRYGIGHYNLLSRIDLKQEGTTP
jgi:CRP-like cAMP-binding protein